ncbi:hypothetical protein [Kitasatospora paranensis]|uniref:CopC domain-containing protein n=1 Tax=Kitasatospora paranensis TaxID=258053 RepID=A0ABW2G0C6_9ACTN
MDNPRSAVRRAVPAGLFALGLAVLGPAPAAHAHGDTIRLTVTGLRSGHPTATAVWENDRDPVDEAVAGTLGATAADGTSVGPWPLVPVPGLPGVLTTEQTLPPGRWTVVAETAFPALGRGEAVLDVPAGDPPGAIGPVVPSAARTAPTAPHTSRPAALTSAGPASAGPAVARTAAPVAADDRPVWLLALAGLGVAVLAALAVAVATRLLRRSVRP